MMNLFTVRHAHSLGQVRLSAYAELGDCKLPLTVFGTEQAAITGERFERIAEEFGINSFDTVSSTCLRADQTEQEIAQVLGPARLGTRLTDPRLDKQKFGKFDGLFSADERAAKVPDEFAAYKVQLLQRGEYDTRPPDGESIADVAEKTAQLVVEISNRENVIFVTHGLHALCIEQKLLGLPKGWVLQNADTVENCRITHFQGDVKHGFRKIAVHAGPSRPDFEPEIAAAKFAPAYTG
jgi:broad specificity phosphatase PhoE